MTIDGSVTGRSARVNESISYLPLPAPIWARIKADKHSQLPPIMHEAPSAIYLDTASTCPCRIPRTKFDSHRPTEMRQCFIYGLLEGHRSWVQVQKCPHCPQGYIGPECTALGIFNLNNRSLFTLALLDDYTAHFTRSETPFTSWVAATACRYLNHQSPVDFIKEKAFRTAWFSYIRLVELNNDMRCLSCGDTPAVTIWDGVTLSFNRKHLLPTLRPPTVVDERSEIKQGVRHQHGLQLIADKHLRKHMQMILNGKPLLVPQLPGSSDSDGPPTPTAATKEMMDRMELVPGVVAQLLQLDAAVGVLFHQFFGFENLLAKGTPPRAYSELFRQVW